VWVNEHGLPVRVSVQRGSPRHRGEPFWSATEFSDYGVDVSQARDAIANRRLLHDEQPTDH
jgi:hypothetical protein